MCKQHCYQQVNLQYMLTAANSNLLQLAPQTCENTLLMEFFWPLSLRCMSINVDFCIKNCPAISYVFLANVLNLISSYLLNNAMTVLVKINNAFQDENANKNTRKYGTQKKRNLVSVKVCLRPLPLWLVES